MSELLKKISKDNFLSFFIYFCSVGLFTLADFLVIHYSTTEYIANWAFYKSVIFVLGGMCILGFDQILLRDINKFKEIKKQFLFQSSFISLILSLFLITKLESYLDILKLILILFFYSLLLFYAGYWRANKNLSNSQISTNSWKIFVFLTLLISIFFIKLDVIDIFLISLSFSVVILFFLGVFQTKKNNQLNDENNNLLNKNNKNIHLFMMGLYFFLHSFSLVIANYGEQFIINYFGNYEISKVIFSYITFYSSIVLAGAGFIGFYLGPKVRYDADFGIIKYKIILKRIFIFGICMVVLNSIIVYLVNLYFLKQELNDIFLWFLVLILTILRVIYIMPSLCLGVFGSIENLKRSAIYSLIFALIYVIIFSFLMYRDYNQLKYIVLLLMILHWMSKIYISNYYVNLCLKKRFL